MSFCSLNIDVYRKNGYTLIEQTDRWVKMKKTNYTLDMDRCEHSTSTLAHLLPEWTVSVYEVFHTNHYPYFQLEAIKGETTCIINIQKIKRPNFFHLYLELDHNQRLSEHPEKESIIEVVDAFEQHTVENPSMRLLFVTGLAVITYDDDVHQERLK